VIEFKKILIKEDNHTLVDISFELRDSIALVGQSGSGKSLTLKSILGMLPNNLTSNIDISSKTVLSLDNISFIPQNPFTALSPLTKISKQFFVDEDEKIRLMSLVGLDSALLDRFPPELSGGQLQRVVTAIALEKRPYLMLLDEPTTALDEDNKMSIIALLKELQQKLGFLMIFVTHDIDTIKDLCNHSIVMKDGKIVESGETMSVISNPKDKYTRQLTDSSFKSRDFRC
jgi:peptide/nickel transport system ATP-binding protein